jgi:hypothetical protein
MSDFPSLRTGALLQYPAQTGLRCSTDVLRFADGSEQRFRDYQTPLRRWVIRLDLLDDGELHVLREFFLTMSGAAGSFTFTDPRDGVKYTNCSFEDATMDGALLDEGKARTVLTVRENRG